MRITKKSTTFVLFLALGMPQFRYPNYIDRAPAPVTRK